MISSQHELMKSASNVKTRNFLKTELKNVLFKNEAEITTGDLG